MSLGKMPVKAGGGDKFEHWARHEGIHSNPESSNHNQAPSHSQTTVGADTCKPLYGQLHEGGRQGANCCTNAQFGAHNGMTFQRE